MIRYRTLVRMKSVDRRLRLNKEPNFPAELKPKLFV